MTILAYTAAIDRVHDGDTIHATIFVPGIGFNMAMLFYAEVRLAGINAPELTGVNAVAGEAATIGLMQLLTFVPNGKRTRPVFGTPGDYLTDSPVTLKLHVDSTNEREKYGRVLGTPIVGGMDVCAAMIAGGFAVPYLVHALLLDEGNVENDVLQ